VIAVDRRGVGARRARLRLASPPRLRVVARLVARAHAALAIGMALVLGCA
jgi:hypothetical protein